MSASKRWSHALIMRCVVRRYMHYIQYMHNTHAAAARAAVHIRCMLQPGQKLNFHFRGLLFTSHWLNLQHWTGFYIAVYGNFQGLLFIFEGSFLHFGGKIARSPRVLFFLASTVLTNQSSRLCRNTYTCMYRRHSGRKAIIHPLRKGISHLCWPILLGKLSFVMWWHFDQSCS